MTKSLRDLIAEAASNRGVGRITAGDIADDAIKALDRERVDPDLRARRFVAKIAPHLTTLTDPADVAELNAILAATEAPHHHTDACFQQINSGESRTAWAQRYAVEHPTPDRAAVGEERE